MNAAPPLVLDDRPDRERIAGADPADLDRCFAVEAGAGSGKTTALVHRVVALVEREDPRGEQEDPLAEVVAITFTRKAAAELRAQVYRQLAERAVALAASSDPADGARLGRVRRGLSHLDAACIDTIHGFCSRLLRADALAVGLPPDYAIVEGREAEEDQRAFWRRYPDRAAGGADLADVGLLPAGVEGLFQALCLHADRLPEPYGAQAPDLAPAAALARRRVREWQVLRPDPPRPGPRDQLQVALDSAERLLYVRGLETPLDQARFIEAVLRGYNPRESKGRVGLGRWVSDGGQKSNREEKAQAVQLRDEEVPHLADELLPVLRAWQAYAYDRALAYVRGAVEDFAAERRQRGRPTTDDLLHLAARLLRESPDARRRAAARHRRFLVDEFQDTDPVQTEVLFLLAAEDAGADAPETDWRRCRPRPGSLFLVGDPKQSIYRFRRADIETYAEALRLLAAAGGERLLLTTCFRTLPALCGWLNGRLGGPFADDAAADGGAARQAPYVPLRSGRPDGPAGRTAPVVVARIDVAYVKGDGAVAIAAKDAAQIAAFVRAAVDGRAAPALYEGAGDRRAGASDPGTVFGPGANYGDFLVLCRGAGRFSTYAAALEAKGVPYAFAGDKGLGRTDELRALVDLLEAVRDPLDGTAVLAHRMGLLGGLDTPTLLGLRRRDLDEDGQARAEDASRVLRAAREALASLPLGAALERIVQHSGLLSVAAAQPAGGSARAGSILKLLSLARKYEGAGLHWTEAANLLRDLVEGVTKDGRVTLEEGASDAVRIMTVHQAKGLQAPVVFLADPYSRFDPAPDVHAGRGVDGRPFVTVPLLRKHQYNAVVVAAPRRWHERDEAEEHLFGRAEERRLAYVAATRAEGLLVVSRYLGKDGAKAGLGPWGLYHDGLNGAVVLADLVVPPAQPVEAASLPDVEGVAPDFAEARRRALAHAARPSYASGSVTADDSDAIVRRRLEGVEAHGKAFGTAVHGLFQWAVRSRHEDLPDGADGAVVDRLWRDPGVDEALKPEAARALAALRTSELWGRLQSAVEVHTEIPVAGAGLAADGDGAPAGVSVGAIDLAYRDAGGWHLVDYKTDPAGSGAEEEALDERYAPQLRAYGRLWAAATGAPPASLSLYATRMAKTLPVTTPPAA